MNSGHWESIKPRAPVERDDIARELHRWKGWPMDDCRSFVDAAAISGGLVVMPGRAFEWMPADGMEVFP